MENAPPSERDLKPHKDKGLKITEEDLKQLRESKHEENLQRPLPRKKNKSKKVAQKTSDVGVEKKEDFLSKEF